MRCFYLKLPAIGVESMVRSPEVSWPMGVKEMDHRCRWPWWPERITAVTTQMHLAHLSILRSTKTRYLVSSRYDAWVGDFRSRKHIVFSVVPPQASFSVLNRSAKMFTIIFPLLTDNVRQTGWYNRPPIELNVTNRYKIVFEVPQRLSRFLLSIYISEVVQDTLVYYWEVKLD